MSHITLSSATSRFELKYSWICSNCHQKNINKEFVNISYNRSTYGRTNYNIASGDLNAALSKVQLALSVGFGNYDIYKTLNLHGNCSCCNYKEPWSFNTLSLKTPISIKKDKDLQTLPLESFPIAEEINNKPCFSISLDEFNYPIECVNNQNPQDSKYRKVRNFLNHSHGAATAWLEYMLDTSLTSPRDFSMFDFMYLFETAVTVDYLGNKADSRPDIAALLELCDGFAKYSIVSNYGAAILKRYFFHKFIVSFPNEISIALSVLSNKKNNAIDIQSNLIEVIPCISNCATPSHNAENSTNNSKQPVQDTNRLFCRKCGSELPIDSIFCIKCGTKVIIYWN